MIFNSAVLYIASAQTDLPKIIQPSPEVAQLFRFQDYPVDYSTGLPDIQVPLYDIKSSELEVPLTISYHASGRRVYDQAGPIGLGRSLNAGGTISRIVYGSPDFGTPAYGTYKFPYPFRTSDLSNYNDYEYFERITHFDKNPNITPYSDDWKDAEYDIFSYSFGKNNGKFIFRDSDNVKTPVLLPYKPFKITPIHTNNDLTGIEIIDDKGTLYRFNTTESYQEQNNGANTAYLLSQMISADKTDTISFLYNSVVEKRYTAGETIIF